MHMDSSENGLSTAFILPLIQFLVGLLLFIALLTGERDLTVLGMLIFGMAGCAKIWSRMSASKISCKADLDKKKVFPRLPQVKFHETGATLVYLPFEDRGHEMVQHSMPISIQEKTLEFGRQL